MKRSLFKENKKNRDRENSYLGIWIQGQCFTLTCPEESKKQCEET